MKYINMLVVTVIQTYSLITSTILLFGAFQNDAPLCPFLISNVYFLDAILIPTKGALLCLGIQKSQNS